MVDSASQSPSQGPVDGSRGHRWWGCTRSRSVPGTSGTWVEYFVVGVTHSIV